MKHLTIQQVAAALAVNHKTVRNLVKKGLLRAKRIGRVLRVEEDDLRAYLARRTVPPPVEPAKRKGRTGRVRRGVKDWFADGTTPAGNE